MVEYTKHEVEIGTNGHIKLNGKTISLLCAWNKYEDIVVDHIEDMHVNS